MQWFILMILFAANGDPALSQAYLGKPYMTFEDCQVAVEAAIESDATRGIRTEVEPGGLGYLCVHRDAASYSNSKHDLAYLEKKETEAKAAVQVARTALWKVIENDEPGDSPFSSINEFVRNSGISTAVDNYDKAVTEYAVWKEKRTAYKATATDFRY